MDPITLSPGLRGVGIHRVVVDSGARACCRVVGGSGVEPVGACSLVVGGTGIGVVFFLPSIFVSLSGAGVDSCSPNVDNSRSGGCGCFRSSSVGVESPWRSLNVAMRDTKYLLVAGP